MLKFYNSLSKKKETFNPLEDGKVTLYTCGPTVYDFSHIGNFRTFLFEDLLKRTLTAFGFDVYHIMNITDVDDKTIKKANHEKKSLEQVTQKYTAAFMEDIKSLRIQEADLYPSATEHIEKMIELIRILIDKGYAYLTNDGSVFFKIDNYSDYGNLVDISHFSIDEKRQIDDEYGLDNVNDFALWKSHKKDDGDIFWDSPWGKGRPGWHIECSAMSTQYLGNHFDIHCGGVDNKFPHHENEIAQSVCALDESFVNYWLHSEFLMVENQKMSKSLNNYFILSDLFDNGFTAEEFRFIILSSHYRSKVNFSLTRKSEAKSAINRIEELRSRLLDISQERSTNMPEDAKSFNSYLGDDLDTPNALATFFNWIRLTNQKIDEDKYSENEAAQANTFIDYFDSIFAILSNNSDIPEDIMSIVRLREKYRKNKDWKKSDLLRDDLLAKGWLIKDTSNGSKLTKI